jgi:hypothetical protein
MIFVTRQTFVETVDGSRTLFTTRQNYLSGSFLCAQGSVLIDPSVYTEVLPNQIQFTEAPLSENGMLWYNAFVIETGIPGLSPYFWTGATLADYFGYTAAQFPNVADAAAMYALFDRLIMEAAQGVQFYIGSDLWLTAITSPVLPENERLVYAVIMAVAFRTRQLIRDRYGVGYGGVTASQVRSREVDFEGAGLLKETYFALSSDTTKTTAGQTENDLLLLSPEDLFGYFLNAFLAEGSLNEQPVGAHPHIRPQTRNLTRYYDDGQGLAGMIGGGQYGYPGFLNGRLGR